MLTDHEKELITALVERLANLEFVSVDGLPDFSRPLTQIWHNDRDHRNWLFVQSDEGGLLTRDREFARKALEPTIKGHVGVDLIPQDKNLIKDIAKFSFDLKLTGDAAGEFIYGAIQAKIKSAHHFGFSAGMAELGKTLIDQGIATKEQVIQAKDDLEQNVATELRAEDAQFKKVLDGDVSIFTSHEW